MGDTILDLTTITLTPEKGGGVYDDIHIWNRPLTDAEASALYNAGNGVDLAVKK